MSITINLKEVFPSDPQQIFSDKLNENFNKLLALGVGQKGEQGEAGPAGPALPGPQGDRGDRGSLIYTGSGTPDVGLDPSITPLDLDSYWNVDTVVYYQYDGDTETWDQAFDLRTFISDEIDELTGLSFTDKGDFYATSPGDEDDRFVTFLKTMDGADDNNNPLLLLKNFTIERTDTGDPDYHQNWASESDNDFMLFGVGMMYSDYTKSVDPTTFYDVRSALVVGSSFIDTVSSPSGKYLSNDVESLKIRHEVLPVGSYLSPTSYVPTAIFSMGALTNDVLTGELAKIQRNTGFKFESTVYDNGLSDQENMYFAIGSKTAIDSILDDSYDLNGWAVEYREKYIMTGIGSDDIEVVRVYFNSDDYILQHEGGTILTHFSGTGLSEYFYDAQFDSLVAIGTTIDSNYSLRVDGQTYIDGLDGVDVDGSGGVGGKFYVLEGDDASGSDGGDGGNISLFVGDGGASDVAGGGSGGDGGALLLYSGTGGDANGSGSPRYGGNGGDIEIRTGSGGDGTHSTTGGGSGGDLTLRTGDGGDSGYVSLDGGDINMLAGDGGTSTGLGSGDGGSIYLNPGDRGSVSNNRGDIHLNYDGSNSYGDTYIHNDLYSVGVMYFTDGATNKLLTVESPSSPAAGDDLIIQAQPSLGDYNGGDLRLRGGYTTVSTPGVNHTGDIYLETVEDTAGIGNTVSGDIYIQTADSDSYPGSIEMVAGTSTEATAGGSVTIAAGNGGSTGGVAGDGGFLILNSGSSGTGTIGIDGQVVIREDDTGGIEGIDDEILQIDGSGTVEGILREKTNTNRYTFSTGGTTTVEMDSDARHAAYFLSLPGAYTNRVFQVDVKNIRDAITDIDTLKSVGLTDLHGIVIHLAFNFNLEAAVPPPSYTYDSTLDIEIIDSTLGGGHTIQTLHFQEMPSSFNTGEYGITLMWNSNSTWVILGEVLDYLYNHDTLSAPPTAAELNTIFGTPAERGAGWSGVIKDTIGGQMYTVITDGTSWYHVAGTLAV